MLPPPPLLAAGAVLTTRHGGGCRAGGAAGGRSGEGQGVPGGGRAGPGWGWRLHVVSSTAPPRGGPWRSPSSTAGHQAPRRCPRAYPRWFCVPAGVTCAGVGGAALTSGRYYGDGGCRIVPCRVVSCLCHVVSCRCRIVSFRIVSCRVVPSRVRRGVVLCRHWPTSSCPLARVPRLWHLGGHWHASGMREFNMCVLLYGFSTCSSCASGMHL